MEYFNRILNFDSLSRKSWLLFGPRQTGKSWLLRHKFPDSTYYNLLHSDVYYRLSSQPHLLREEIKAEQHTGPIIIDEIQKIPDLLDEVHSLIEETPHRFVLTGSSSRKLKRGGANLLGGRALQKRLFPLVSAEIPDFDLLRAINYGSLPSIYVSEFPIEDLQSYVGTYLKEEIQAEGLVRRLQSFSSFLEKSSLTNTEILNFSKIASDIGVSPHTIREYYSILEDTLIGTMLPPFGRASQRKSVSKSKFYFFDIGVSNLLAKRFQITQGSELFGKSFEHFLFNELTAYLHYTGDLRNLSFWRSGTKEVDFIIEDEVAIEVKATERVSDKHLKGILTLQKEERLKRYIVVSMDPRRRALESGIEVIPWRDFLNELWDGNI